jgi:hypothetical protein
MTMGLPVEPRQRRSRVALSQAMSAPIICLRPDRLEERQHDLFSFALLISCHPDSTKAVVGEGAPGLMHG